MIQEAGQVCSIERFRPAHFSMQLEMPGIAKVAKPGQFIHLKVAGAKDVLLRRPFSIAGVNGSTLRLVVRIVGEGTKALAQFEVGQTCEAIGPLGRGFDVSESRAAYLIAGGIGNAPLVFLQDSFSQRNKKSTFFIGAQTSDEFPLGDLETKERSVIACTDDGTFGHLGFVTTIFEKHLRKDKLKDAQVYCCGPIPMMKETARICAEYNLPLQVSMENRMGCAVGVCQGCALKLVDNQDRGGFRLVCHDGPVFAANKVDWSLF